MIRGVPQYAPWQDDPDPPEYWEDEDYAEMRARLRRYWGIADAKTGVSKTPVLGDAFGKFEEQKHPRGQPENKGRFASKGAAGGAAAAGPPRPSAIKVLAAAKARAEGGKGKAEAKPEVTHPGKGYSKHAKLVNGVIHTTDVKDAQRALMTGKKVELDQIRGVSVLLERLGEVADKMIERGEKAPNINLCDLTIAGSNLFCSESKGIPRIEMPQMTEEQTEKFKEYLVDKGYTVTPEEQYASHLRATQNELNGAKVAGIAKNLKSGAFDSTLRTVVSDDDYILDGHHRWAAKIGNDSHDGHLTNDTKYPIARVGIDIITLLEEAHKFTGGKGRKGVHDARPWDESKYERGQPENKGQFASKGAAGGSAKSGAEPVQKSAKGAQPVRRSPEEVLRAAKSTRPMGPFLKAAHLAGAGYIAEAKALVAGSTERQRAHMARANEAAVAEAKKLEKATAKKIGKEEFDKAGIRFRVLGGGGERDETKAEAEAIALWEEKVGIPPDEFKKTFMGGMPGTMIIKADPGQPKYNVQGEIMGEGEFRGVRVATFSRDIDLRKKEAYSALFEVSEEAQKAGIGKKLLAGNIETYEKLGIEKVKVTAGLTVGGYAWAKYGYVPTQDTWDDLRHIIKSRMGEGKARTYTGNGTTETIEAESWDQLPESVQDQVRNRWLDDSREEFYESEVSNWRDSEEPMAQARRNTADEFNGGGVMDMPLWAEEAMDELTTARRDAGEGDYPYSDRQLYAAMALSNDEGRDDAAFGLKWNDDKLNSYVPPGLVPGQQTLPGIEEVKPADYLTPTMREEIATAIMEAAEKKADDEQINIEPPAYISESVQEYQLEYWEMADEDTRMDQARRFDLHNIEIEEEVELDEEGFIIRPAGEGVGAVEGEERGRAGRSDHCGAR